MKRFTRPLLVLSAVSTAVFVGFGLVLFPPPEPIDVIRSAVALAKPGPEQQLPKTATDLDGRYVCGRMVMRIRDGREFKILPGSRPYDRFPAKVGPRLKVTNSGYVYEEIRWADDFHAFMNREEDGLFYPMKKILDDGALGALHWIRHSFDTRSDTYFPHDRHSRPAKTSFKDGDGHYRWRAEDLDTEDFSWICHKIAVPRTETAWLTAAALSMLSHAAIEALRSAGDFLPEHNHGCSNPSGTAKLSIDKNAFVLHRCRVFIGINVGRGYAISGQFDAQTRQIHSGGMTALAAPYTGRKKRRPAVGQAQPFDDGYDYAAIESDQAFFYTAGRVPVYTTSKRLIKDSYVEGWPMPESGIEVKQEDYWFDFTYKNGTHPIRVYYDQILGGPVGWRQAHGRIVRIDYQGKSYIPGVRAEDARMLPYPSQMSRVQMAGELDDRSTWRQIDWVSMGFLKVIHPNLDQYGRAVGGEVIDVMHVREPEFQEAFAEIGR